MFAVRKNQVVVTTLVVMIAVAGYLNFNQTDKAESVANEEERFTYEAVIDDSTEIRVLADDSEEVASLEGSFLDPITAEAGYEEDDDTGAAVLVNAPTVSNTYFVQAKLEREQSRAKQKDMLTEMINNENLDTEQKNGFAKNMLLIQERIEKETSAEAMIKAKGFNEAYVRIDDETVDVVINAETLNEQQAAQIEDIEKRKTGFSSDKIRISTLKKH